MACTRTVKPEFWTDETIVELSMTARLLFIGLWNFADHEGRMEFSVKRIKMLVFPAEDNFETTRYLGELHGQNLIEVYRLENKLYLQVINFKKHQKIDVRYAKSRIPPPESAVSRRIPLVEWNGMEWNGKDNNTVRQAEPPVKDSEPFNLKPGSTNLNDDGFSVSDQEPELEKPEVKDPPPEKPKAVKKADAVIVLEFLNAKANRNYRPVPANLDMIKARLKEYTLIELKQVIALQVREWLGDDKMDKFLRPKTLFNRTNCAQYIGELVPPEEKS